jgi:hypothetical protein
VTISFLEIGHIGYKKIENFMLILKLQTYLSDKMPPKKVIQKFKKLHCKTGPGINSYLSREGGKQLS